jgi:DNA-binding CsgD family transcriptional regulator
MAHVLIEEGLTLSREIHFKWGLAFLLGLSGLIALWQGNEYAASALLKEALLMRGEVGDRRDIRWGLYCLGWVAFAHWDVVIADTMYKKVLKILQQLDDPELQALCLEGWGSVIVSQQVGGRTEGAPFVDRQAQETATRWVVQLWGMAEACREVSDMPLLPGAHPAYEQAVVAACTQLGERAFATAWAQGRVMTAEQALAARALAAKPVASYPDGLTVREVEVLRLLAQGLTNAQIAEALIISSRTVNSHLTAIYQKIHVTTRAAATRYAMENNLL